MLEYYNMWFAFAILSAVFAGLNTFGLKVAVERRYDTYLISALSSLVSFIIAVVLFVFTSSWSGVPFSIYWLGFVGAIVYLIYAIARMESLRFIDAAIFFPLYKVIGPAAAAGIGIFLLSEVVSTAEVIGIALSCMVPLLLITRKESHRQKNLKLGLVLLVISTVLAAISAAIASYAVKPDPSYAIPLIVISHAFTFIFGLGVFLRKHKLKDMVNESLAHCTRPFIGMTLALGFTQFFAFYLLLLAFTGSSLSVVYSINAHYIIIPVILSVWLYKEHWNFQKAAALVISLIALAMLHP